MKITKRVLSVLLVILLGFGLFAFAAAAKADPKAPIITKQPVGPTEKAGNAAVLKVEAELPAGVKGKLSYAWYDYNWKPGDPAKPIAASKTLTIPTSKNMIDDHQLFEMRSYCVVVTNTYTEGGKMKTSYVKSNLVNVTVFHGYIDSLRTMLTISYEGHGGGAGAIFLMILLFPLELLTLSLSLFTTTGFYFTSLLARLLN